MRCEAKAHPVDANMLGALSLKGLGITGEGDTGPIASIQLATDAAVANAVGRWCAAHQTVPDSLTVARAQKLDGFWIGHFTCISKDCSSILY